MNNYPRAALRPDRLLKRNSRAFPENAPCFADPKVVSSNLIGRAITKRLWKRLPEPLVLLWRSCHTRS